MVVLSVLAIVIAMYLGGFFTSQVKKGRTPPSALPILVNHAGVVSSEREPFLRMPLRISRLVFSEGIPPNLTLLIELDPEFNRDWFVKNVTGYLVGDGPGDQLLMDNLSTNLPVDGESRQFQVEVDLWDLQPDATYLLHVDIDARQSNTDTQVAVTRIEEGDAVIVRAEWNTAQDR